MTGIVHHTAHPHVAADGAVFNLATVPKIDGPHYCVVKFPRVDPGKIKKCIIVIYLLTLRFKWCWFFFVYAKKPAARIRQMKCLDKYALWLPSSVGGHCILDTCILLA